MPKKKLKKSEARPSATFVWKDAEHGLIEAGDVFVLELNRDHRYALRTGKRHVASMITNHATCRGTIDQLVHLRKWLQQKHPSLLREWAGVFNDTL